MFSFLRSDLAKLTAYTPHPGGMDGSPVSSSMVIDRLDTNECPFDLPQDLKQKLAENYQQLIETNRYPDGGHESLKTAIADYVNEALETPINTANISVGNGSDELIRSLLIATCLGGECSILVATPTFSMYGILAQTLGIPVRTVGRNLANFEMDLEAAQQAIANRENPSVRVVFVVHPNSPTANALTAAEIAWLKSLPPHILVVIDEAYFEFSQHTLVGELSQRPNWVVMRTLSKAFRLASHRVGYAIAHPEVITTLEKIRLPYNLPSFSQAAAEVALVNRQKLLETIPQILADREQLIAALSQNSALKIWSSAANFIYLRLQENSDDALAQLVNKLKAQGTLVRHTGGGIRITIGSSEENQRTLRRLQELC